ncbi:MAG TPA: tetratricopeptide repeat protein [Rhizomicrobium sp.]|jgi:tetratricopeptide (TPR) repeat protein
MLEVRKIGRGMHTDSKTNMQDLLADAVTKLNAGSHDAAKAILTEIIAVAPQHPVALYLLGMAYFDTESFEEAERQFRVALRVCPDQPKICLHLARTLRALKRPYEAIIFARLVLSEAPSTEAQLELAKALEESGSNSSAEAVYRTLLAREPNPVAANNLANLLDHTGCGSAARTVLTTAMDQAGEAERPMLRQQIGRSLKRQRCYADALVQMRAAAPDLADAARRESHLDQAILCQHLGEPAQAANLYDLILQDHPLDLGVHTLLSELRLRIGQKDYLVSYDTALARRPMAAMLPVAKGQVLLKRGDVDAAQTCFEAALRIDPRFAPALGGLARALEAQDQKGAAHDLYTQALMIRPDDSDTLEGFAGFLLRRSEARQAQTLAERAVKARPISQAGWALLGLCYRANGDARENWLNDYTGHVQIFDLPAPDGYRDMNDFNQALAADLGARHAGAGRYLHQTLRGGTQLHDEIFYNGHALADRLMPRIDAAIHQYVAGLKPQEGQPLVSRRNRGFRYAGSWSSRLSANDFHVNHIHQKGWISSCYYVAVPDGVCMENTQGWIKFGQPSEDFGDIFAVQRTIEPRPGRLVLFPSYMWHGTVPFQSPQNRITIAFDAVPA